MTATIPAMWPPVKIGPMARLVSNGSHEYTWPFDWEDERKNIENLWKNTTGAMGPITSFDELSTFVTSIRARL